MNRRTACDFDRPFGASVGNRRRSNMSSALSDTSYDEGPEPSPGHAMGVRSGSMMVGAGPMWATTPRDDHRVSVGSIASTPHRGSYGAPGPSSAMSFSEGEFPVASGSGAAPMPPPLGMPVSPFDQIDLGVGDEFISFDDLLKDLFGASMPDMTTGWV